MTEQMRIILDGDFAGHPFRGNQHVKAGINSRSAVHSSKNAKRAENRGTKRAAKKAHRSAHYAHKAALSTASGAAKHYHRKMARFHGRRSGLLLDSVPGEVFDAAMSAAGMVEGVIRRGGDVVGRVMIGGDGKAMVYVGAEGTQRVTLAGGETAMWSDDDAVDMVNALFTSAAPDAGAPTQSDERVMFLASVASGERDGDTLSDLLTRIGDAVEGLRGDGLLTGDVDDVAASAIKHWARLDEKAYG